jgi:(E)-4-hydroxy-3-methylbut-2-enyl-diphosphate synthase
MLLESQANVEKYCAGPYSYRRRRTHEVMVGDVGVGGDNPIRVQSMTTPRTRDIEAQVAQITRLVEAGCEIVRVTTPTPADARALKDIREGLLAKGVRVPLVADVHFSPNAAMEAALWADKVRINPGNFADAKKFAVEEYTDEEYVRELERIAEKFRPLVARCKERSVAIRIGTNHGSLSDRIMTRYGDTPLGMVESALEFVRMAEAWGYRDLILSMKASNPKVMIAAYRLLAARMGELGMTYPFHLGVTEAGNGEDGRIKSAAGIGSLLEDGIGDTVRVSLTEDPEYEIPVAYDLVRRYNAIAPERAERGLAAPALPDERDPFGYAPRQTQEVALGEHLLGGGGPALVFARLDGKLSMTAALGLNRPVGRDALRPDALVLPVQAKEDVPVWRNIRVSSGLMSARPALVAGDWAYSFPQVGADAYEAQLDLNEENNIDQVAAVAAAQDRPLLLEMEETADTDELREMAARHEFPVVHQLLERAGRAERLGARRLILALRVHDRAYRIRAYRLLDSLLRREGKDWNVHLVVPPGGENLIDASISLGSLLCDGIGSSVAVEGETPHPERLRLAFNILQASGARLTKTEFIACPSCGRTLFDLQTTTERIKQRTGHLKGVKIAVMGCIVNGLGELADADFGYMGSGEGKVNLFVGKTCVEKNLPEAVADERLVGLIKEHSRWVDPPESGEEAEG